MKQITNTIAVLSTFFIILLFAPSLGFFVGWVYGHIISWTCGDGVIDAMNSLSQTQYFKKEMLPNIVGLLSLISSFIISTVNANKNNRELNGEKEEKERSGDTHDR